MNAYPLPFFPIPQNEMIIQEINHLKDRVQHLEDIIQQIEKEEKNYLKKDDNYYMI